MKRYSILMVSIIVFVSSSLVPSPSFATGMDIGPSDEKVLENWMDQFFNQKEIKEMNIPGAAVVVVKDGKVLLKKGYGYANQEKKIPVDPNQTVFRIASVSKVFTAAAVMQLVEQEKIQLNGDVNSYLDEVQIKNPFPQFVTPKHLLTHTTGFHTEVMKPEDIQMDVTKFSPLKDYVKERLPKVTRQPGESYMYDNYASTLQGYLVEKISGMPFEEYMKKNIFEPLHMKNSNFAPTSAMQEHLATGYDEQGNPMQPYTIIPTVNPAGSMNTTAEDMAKYMIMHLNGGTYGNDRILKNETIQEMNQYHSAIHSKFPDTGYGFENISFQSANGQYVIGKGGSLPDFSSAIWFLPKQKLGIFLTYNKQSTTDLREQFFEKFMDHYYPQKEEESKYMRTPKEELKHFEGEYMDLRTRFLVTKITAIGNGELLAEDGVLGIKSKLKQLDPLFFVDEQGRKLAFKANKSHTISYLKYVDISSYAEKSKLSYYKDVSKKSPNADYIRYIQLLELTQNQTGKFQPNKPITRAEMAFMTARTLSQFNVSFPEKSVLFKDVPGHYWAKRELEIAVNLGIMKESTEKSFSPEESVSRQEAAVILINMMKILNPGLKDGNAKLKDKIDPWAEQAVKTVVALELYGPEVTKYRGGVVKYYAKRNMTHQEAAAMIARAFHKSFGN
ncbi:serine hydrolase [Paenibacillus sp. 102]|uniref:serine hydrolase n=1 Tax=Paenibacillus sp. 102 TaxID=3120823 RepID=UPI0031BB10CC